MTEARRIAVFHDSLEFGGHERAFLAWLPGLLASPRIARITLVYPRANQALELALRAVSDSKLQLRPSAFAKRAAEPYLGPFRLAYRRFVAATLAAVRPDTVLLLQGRIENLAAVMCTVGRDVELVSYLPMAHSGREMGRWPPLAALTDRVKRGYYARPDRLIAPSAAVADQLRRAGARGEVRVVRNVPAAEARRGAEPSPRRGAGAKRVALYLGRFDRGQKGLDRLLQAMSVWPDGLSDWEFRFVGRGPDEGWLRARLARLPAVASRVDDWSDDPAEALAGADVLLLPSRYEGVPLVLLEALAARTPVLASPIDVFAEHLPAANLFDFGDRHGLATALREASSAEGRRRFAAHAASLDVLADVADSTRRFEAAVLGDPEPEAAVELAGPAPNVRRLRS